MAKTRRTFTPEFKAEAVKLVTEQGKSLAEVARDLDLGESMLRSLEAGPGQGRRPGLPRQGQPARPGGGAAPPPGREQAAHDGARHPEKSDGLLRQGVVMRYDFVERHRGRWPVRLMCRVLRVSPGGYYDWRGRPQSARAARRDALVVAIKAIHGEVKARYGSPRIHAELVARGEPCCVNTVARLMRRARDRRQDEAEVPLHDRLEPRPPRGRERPGSPVRAGGRRIGPGRPTSPTSRPARAGSTWRPWRTSTRGGSWAGRWARGSTAGWSSTPWRWPWPGACPARGWWPTRTGGASTPASTTRGCWPATGSSAA